MGVWKGGLFRGAEKLGDWKGGRAPFL